MKALAPYFKKRDFSITSEPQGGKPSTAGALSFVIQKHAATRLHYDFRLELDGTLKSWAVPKGPSLDPNDKRMAVHVEDHPIDYGGFEGSIPAGQYGAGDVIVWDRGTWEPVGDARAGYRAGKLKFRLHGEKLSGGWTLVRMHGHANERQEPWLLIKERDDAARPAAEYNIVDAEPASVLSGKTIEGRPTKAQGAAAVKAAKPAAKKAGATAAKKAAATATTATTATATAKAGAGAQAAARPGKPARPAAADAAAGPPAGAKKAALPKELAPQLATLVAEPPPGDGWIWEIKFDGYRVLARVDGDDVRLFTRRGNDWSERLPALVEAVRGLGLGSAWLDGEIVVTGANGAPDFNALQNAFDSARTGSIQYYLFDLPYCAGHDLRAVPLVERRAVLAALLEKAPASERIRFSQNFDAAPADLLQNACRMRLEGMIGKRADSTYVSKRSPTWIKLKCTHRQEFVVGGWTDPKGARTGIGSLLLGIHDERGKLRFAGGVGSGFDQTSLAALREALDGIASETTPFFEKPRDVRGHWVEPKLVAEVSFGEWTPDGRIRHSVFHGLRDDKPARSITREAPVEADEVTKAVATTTTKAATKRPAAAKTKAAPVAATAGKPAAAAAAPRTAKKAAAGDAEVEGIASAIPTG
jgi:bifunctional non-homologous end joining protein LigD